MTQHSNRAALIMAAGKSTRMKSRLPKAVHPVCGLPLTRHVVDACRASGIKKVIVVVGHEADIVKAAIGDDVQYVLQEEQLGTGHAVMCAANALEGFEGTLVILPGDAPLIKPESIVELVEARDAIGSAAVLLTAQVPNPAMYGRIVRNSKGAVIGIVEAKDASAEIIAIDEICTSIYAFDVGALMPALRQLKPENRQKEYYLTDVVGIFSKDGRRMDALILDDWREGLGINTRVELAEVTAVMRKRINERHMLNGVTMIDPDSVYIDVSVKIAADVTLLPGVHLEGQTTIGPDCVIGPDVRMISSKLAGNVRVRYAEIENSEIDEGTVIGPFTRLRPGNKIGKNVKIGDFVEVKNSVVQDNVSLAHLTYIGDTDLGAGTNVGAGTITCNYDGKRKHRTVIGEGAFIGSNSTLNAPVTIGDGAFIASGSVIGKDVPQDALGIARSQQINKEGWAKRRREASE